MRTRPPDKRLDWRDPDMPCIRVTEDVWSGELAVELVPPEVVQAVAIEDMGMSGFPVDTHALYAQSVPCLDDCKTPNTCRYAGCRKLEVGE
jgi:hypothetical protein